MKHSPLPWKIQESLPNEHLVGTSVYDANGQLVIAGEFDGYMTPFDCRDTSIEGLGNLSFVINACNSHYEMLDFIHHLIKLLNQVMPDVGKGSYWTDAVYRKAQSIIAKTKGVSDES